MSVLPKDIKDIFFKTIKGDFDVLEFEQWLYESKEIEQLLTATDYLDLISLNYKSKYAKYETTNILKKYIDAGEYETWKLLELMNEVKNRTEKSATSLMQFYDLYCKGYDFLMDLGLGYGLSLIVPRLPGTTADTWEDLNKNDQQKLLNGLYPNLDKEIDRVINWLITGKIVLTGVQDDVGHFSFKDFRNDTDKHYITGQPPEKKWWQLF